MIVQVITVRLVKTQKSGALSCLLMHSYSAMDRHMQHSVFHTIAFLAFSTPATWCRIFMSHKFMSRIFSVPASSMPASTYHTCAPFYKNSWLAQYLSKYRHKQHLLTSIHTGEYVHRCHLVQINSQKIVCTGWAKKTGPQTHDHNSVNS